MRALVAVLVLTAFPAMAADFRVPRDPIPRFVGINLDRPGALEAIAEANPQRHRQILDIIKAAQHDSCEQQPQVHRAHSPQASACDASIVKMSLPPRKLLDFTLDGVRYTKTIYLERYAGFLPPQ